MSTHDNKVPKLKLDVKPQTVPAPHEFPVEEPEHFRGEGYRVTLFNDDFHTVDEVVGQLIKALECPLDIAVSIMLQAHTRGSAIVIITDQPRAERVANILREILLVVSVEHV